MQTQGFCTKITLVELVKPLPDSVDEIMAENGDQVSELCKSVESEAISFEQKYPVRTVQTQHGDYRTVDEENIVLLHVTRSPVPEEQEQFIWFRKKPFEDDSNDDDDEVSQTNSLLKPILKILEHQSKALKMILCVFSPFHVSE